MLRQARLILVVAATLAAAGTARALPDLTPEIFGVYLSDPATVNSGDVVEGCAGAESGRRLINYSLRARNLGPDDLLLGDPACPNCSLNPGAACGNPLFECSAAHGHPHFGGFATAELVDANDVVVATGHKTGFCLLDFECATPQFSCGYQGISAGCADVYEAGLPCQYIDVTDVNLPQGTYTLRVTVDPDDRIAEANEGNNITTMSLLLSSPPPVSCPVYASTDVPKIIPDLSSAASTLMVPLLTGTISGVRIVGMRGTHTFMSDLSFHLVSPAGTDVPIMQNVCGDADDFDLALADGAAVFTCPPTDGGVHGPSSPLAVLDGEGPSGPWRLEVFDETGGDSGSLDGWGLQICTSCGNGTLDPGEACDDGNTASGDCCSPDCQVAAPDGSACDDADTCTPTSTCTAGACLGSGGCDPCLVCDAVLGCVVPTGSFCQSAPSGRSLVKLSKASTPAGDSLSWKWASSAPVALLDFGSPVDVTDLTLCVFDQGGLKLSTSAPAGGTCFGNPCWTVGRSGIAYRDEILTPDGLLKLRLTAGATGKAKIGARGKGQNLALLSLGLAPPITVRMKRSGGPTCWEATYSAPIRNDTTQLKARSD